MKKLFTISDGRSVFAREEGKVYELVDWKKEERIFCDAVGQHLPDYQRDECDESIYDEQYTDDKTQVTPMIDGFYGYSSCDVVYHPDGMDGCFGVKAKDGTKITEEIFAEVDQCFRYGLLSVRNSENLWGCIDETGNLVIPYKFSDHLRFNQYGVAVGDNTLVDRQGNEIPGTNLNLEDCCDMSHRYFTIALISDAQSESIAVCGRAEDIRVDIYDTKLRQYVVRGIPDGKLDVVFFEGEEDVIHAAIALLPGYDEIELEGQGLIKAKKDNLVDIYDYYQT